jgi:phage portal protein BeeE
MLQVRLQYEQRIRGLMPAAMQRELEDTITSLKEQISALQQRVAILQEDMDMQYTHGIGPHHHSSLSSLPVK